MRSLGLDEARGSDDLIEERIEGAAPRQSLVGERLLEHLGADGDLVETTLREGHEDHVAAGTTEERSIGHPVLLKVGLDVRVPEGDVLGPLAVATVRANVVEEVVLEVVDVIVEVRAPGGVLVGADQGGHGENRGDEHVEFHFFKIIIN